MDQLTIRQAVATLNLGSRQRRGVRKHDALLRVCNAVLSGELTREEAERRLRLFIEYGYFHSGWEVWFNRRLNAAKRIAADTAMQKLGMIPAKHGSWAGIKLHWAAREELCSACADSYPAIKAEMQRKSDAAAVARENHADGHREAVAEALKRHYPVCRLITSRYKTSLAGSLSGLKRHKLLKQDVCSECAQAGREYQRKYRSGFLEAIGDHGEIVAKALAENIPICQVASRRMKAATGTTGGYQRHKRHRQKPCSACREARNAGRRNH